jgi:uncharacterized protein YecE (DUF72 family)
VTIPIGHHRPNNARATIWAAERFKYLYLERKLQSLAKGFGNLQEQDVERAYTIFNNCYQNFGIRNATTMAALAGRENRVIVGDHGCAKVSPGERQSGPI